MRQTSISCGAASSAAADVAFQAGADLELAGLGGALEQFDGCHHHARGAIAALQAMAVAKGLLYRVQRIAGGQALDRGDLSAVGLDRQHRTGFDRMAIELHRAASALGGVAALVRQRLGKIVDAGGRGAGRQFSLVPTAAAYWPLSTSSQRPARNLSAGDRSSRRKGSAVDLHSQA